MQKLIALKPDYLCEGHTGIFTQKDEIIKFIRGFMEFNRNFHRVIEVDQNDIESWYQISLNLYELKEFDFALDFCNYLLEIDPNQREGFHLLEKIKLQNPPEINYVKGLLEKVSKLKRGE